MKRILCGFLMVMMFGAVAAQSLVTSSDTTKKAEVKKKKKPAVLLSNAFETPKLKLGLTISPMLTWAKEGNADIVRGTVRGGVEYGFLVEYFFKPNYGISTGLTVFYGGGNLIYHDSLNKRLFNSDIPTDARFKFQYLTIPVSFKMKTNRIKNVTYWGELGGLVGFCVEAKVDASENGAAIFDNANFLTKNANQTTTATYPDGVFKSTIVNFSLHVGGGIEYAITERTSLILGLVYNNGFVKVVKDRDLENITLNNVVLRIGVLF